MFCTLKAANVVGEPYAFEATPPPFAKKREGKMSKVACTNCRISKLRCSGDRGCCRRCSSKRFQCEYPSPPRSNSQSQRQSTQSPAITETAVGDGLVQVESPCGTAYNGGLPDSIHDFTILDLPTPGAAGTLTDDGANEHISQELEALRQRQQIPTADSNYTFGPGLTDIDDMVFESPVSLATPKTYNSPCRSLCSCLQQAMSANEAIEIIMWGQKDLCSDVYDILQQQKAALAKCEDLIGCRTCCIQPPYVMLLLSMCRKLLATLDKICQGPTEEEDGGTAAAADGSADQRKRKMGGYENSGVESRRGYGISIRERRLDDDDESLVLKSLVTIRVKMLKRIIGRLDEVASQYNWPVHKGRLA
ncbi:hypothetical protein DL767_004907 [Monosporascus sp. MG133]|nr:hypothetical protein DL767_004907 [Monosporascus sp. MG133]